jgi:hypothetical protein
MRWAKSFPASYPAQVIAGDLTPFYVGKYYAYAVVTRTNLGRDGISATLAAFANISDLSFLARPMPFTFALSWAGGGEGKELTYFAEDNSLSVELRTS